MKNQGRYLVVQVILLITSVNVESQINLPCKEPRPAGCPKFVCDLINSRTSDFCKDIECLGITSEDCKGDDDEIYFEPKIAMCGCCDGCVEYLKEGDTCLVSPPAYAVNPHCTHEFCPILSGRCKPDLECMYLGDNSKVCAKKQDYQLITGKSCKDLKNLYLAGDLHWNPNCDADNSELYAPKQCKGQDREQGVCFCVNPEGTRIFGRTWVEKSENQTCACSRKVHALRKEGNIAAIHCSQDGNYEPLQCDMDSGVCYCVEPQTGRLDGAVLPEHQFHLLPCYSAELVNETYLRICESEWVAGERLRREGLLHGVQVLATKDLKCDPDGTYEPVHRIGPSEYCVTKTGAISPYYQPIEQRKMNCQCYRDSVLYPLENREFYVHCDDLSGNYPQTIPDHDDDNFVKCIDQDGFFLKMGRKVPKELNCCLLGECPLNPLCYDSVTSPGGIKPCSMLPGFDGEKSSPPWIGPVP